MREDMGAGPDPVFLGLLALVVLVAAWLALAS